MLPCAAADAQDAAAYYNRGNANSDLGDNQGACKDWKKAAELDDEDAAELADEHCQRARGCLRGISNGQEVFPCLV